jgi:hypothetical protein
MTKHINNTVATITIKNTVESGLNTITLTITITMIHRKLTIEQSESHKKKPGATIP